MNGDFNYRMPVQIICAAGVSKAISSHIKGKRVFILSDPFLFANGVAQTIGDNLEGRQVQYFSEIEPNPTCESVDLAAEQARRMEADCVIGLGGGSSLDVAKIVSCLTTNGGSIYDYYSGGTQTIENRQTQLVCIPTTAGTGSEVTNVGVFTNKKTKVKMPMVNQAFWPDLAVIDPELTYTVPPAVTASTGMDAFCHAIEAYWNRESNPISDALSLSAVKMILQNIKKAYDDPHDLGAREAMIISSLIAGISFSQTRTTGIHALSFPLTAEFGASHGTACSITLPAFIRISQEQAAEKMAAMAGYLGFGTVEELAQAVEDLMVSMNMPVRLNQLGIQEKDLQHITEVGLTPAIVHLTPAEMNTQTVYTLLKSIL